MPLQQVISSNITGEVKETVTTASQEAVKQETEAKSSCR